MFNNFGQLEDGVTTKQRYLNKLDHFISNYANSNKWSKEEYNLIKSNKGLSQIIFDTLIEMKLISVNLNILSFNEYEISNLHTSPEVYLESKWNKLVL